MMKNCENPVVLRYGPDGHIVARLPLETMLQLTSLDFEPEDIIRKLLNTGHSFQLLDGGWLEYENRHC